MKNTLAIIFLTLLLTSIPYLPNTFAQDYTQLELPDGAKARLGKGQIFEVKYSPDGTKLAVVSSIGIWLYDAQTGEELDLFTGHTGYVWSVSFSPDGQTLASGSSHGTILLWDLVPTPTSNTIISLSPSSVASPNIGEQLTFSLNITEGANVSRYQATVAFDTTALSYVQSDNGTSDTCCWQRFGNTAGCTVYLE